MPAWPTVRPAVRPSTRASRSRATWAIGGRRRPITQPSTLSATSSHSASSGRLYQGSGCHSWMYCVIGRTCSGARSSPGPTGVTAPARALAATRRTGRRVPANDLRSSTVPATTAAPIDGRDQPEAVAAGPDPGDRHDPPQVPAATGPGQPEARNRRRPREGEHLRPQRDAAAHREEGQGEQHRGEQDAGGLAQHHVEHQHDERHHQRQRDREQSWPADVVEDAEGEVPEPGVPDPGVVGERGQRGRGR